MFTGCLYAAPEFCFAATKMQNFLNAAQQLFIWQEALLGLTLADEQRLQGPDAAGNPERGPGAGG